MKKYLVIAYFLLLLPQLAFATRVSPVDNGTVTSGVGWRLDPFGSGRMAYHNGYDIAVPVGTPVHPTQKGTVYFAGPWKGYGNLVVVEHGGGYVTLYGHNSEILVKAGDKVDPEFCDRAFRKHGTVHRSACPLRNPPAPRIREGEAETSWRNRSSRSWKTISTAWSMNMPPQKEGGKRKPSCPPIWMNNTSSSAF